ncbi:MAG: META domain-containing protein [Verrucomicrobiota bacterium]
MNLRRIVHFVFCLAAILALTACDKPEPEQPAPEPPKVVEKVFYVGPAMADCVGVAPMVCLMVKDSPEAEYQMFYDPIRGFDYVPGYEYELRVKMIERKDVPADASKFIYLLDEVVGKKKTGRALEDGVWELKDRLPGTEVGIVFQGGKVSGLGGINRYSGSYVLEGSALALKQIVSTRIAGLPAEMDQENQFLEKLAPVAKYRIVGTELRLLDEAGRVVLVFVPGKALGLTSVLWKATGVNNGKGGVASVLAGTEITARFEESGSLSGSAGCNNYVSQYEITEEAVKIDGLGHTRKMCIKPEGIMEQEANYLKALERAATYRIEGKTLELCSAKGSLLVKFVLEGK